MLENSRFVIFSSSKPGSFLPHIISKIEILSALANKMILGNRSQGVNVDYGPNNDGKG